MIVRPVDVRWGMFVVGSFMLLLSIAALMTHRFESFTLKILLVEQQRTTTTECPKVLLRNSSIRYERGVDSFHDEQMESSVGVKL